MAFVDIGLDLQILICTYLHPSDILTLRKTCKTLQLVTRHRTIWVDALHRVCLENKLFLPSFPVPDMSDVELEQAAIAPRRWIEQSTARELSHSEATLFPTATRIIDDPLSGKQISNLILVPGGRYMVGFSLGGLGVWDLGYIPTADCKLIASVETQGDASYGESDVHATPDGMGLVIFSRLNEHYSFYEIYPQSENPQLTKIACLDLPPWHDLRSCISPYRLIWFDCRQGIIFTVWDYRLNASVSFRALVDMNDLEDKYKVVATQTAIVILHEEAIYVWATPPLLPQPPNFDEYSRTQLPPVISIKFPDASPSLYSPAATWSWRTMSSWYFDPSKPLYFDKVYSRCLQLQRFKLTIKPDFSDATLHFINTVQLATNYDASDLPFQSKLCEDTLVYNWNCFGQRKIYTGSTVSRPTLQGNPFILAGFMDRSYVLSICPASGRLVHLDIGRYNGPITHRIVVCDFLPHQRL